MRLQINRTFRTRAKTMSRSSKVVVVGAGVGGLVAALDLAGQGCEVVVVERASTPGGKIRELEIGQTRPMSRMPIFS